MESTHPTPSYRHFRVTAILVTVLAVAAGLLVLADTAQAQSVEVENVGLHTWDAFDEVWTNATNDGITNVQVPYRGLYLVNVTYQVDDLSSIRFRFVEDSDSSSWIQYTFQPNSADTGHDNGTGQSQAQYQVVHVARNVDVDTTGDGVADTNTGDDGCAGGGPANSPRSLNLDGSGETCYFWIETSHRGASPNHRTSGDADEDLSTSPDYKLQVFVRDASTGNTDNREAPGGSTVIAAFEEQVTVEDLQVPPNPEAGLEGPLRMNITDDSVSAFNPRERAWQDTGAWACAFNPLDPSADLLPEDDAVLPAAHTTLFSSDAANPACRVLEDPNNELAEGGFAQPFEGVGQGSDSSPDSPDRRWRNLTFEEPLPLLNGDYDDDFYYRIIVRDPAGNLIITHLPGDTDEPSETFRVADYSVGLEPSPIGITGASANDFQQNPGECEQRGAPDEDCFRTVALTRPYGSIGFSVVAENAGNDVDQIELTWDDRAGDPTWDLSFDDGTPLQVDGTQSPGDPTGVTTGVSIQPAPDAFARDYSPGEGPDAGPGAEEGTFLTAEVTATSGNSRKTGGELPQDQIALTAALAEVRRGSITLDNDGTPGETGIERTPDQQDDLIPITINNTGNTVEDFNVSIDDDPQQSTFVDGDPVCVMSTNPRLDSGNPNELDSDNRIVVRLLNEFDQSVDGSIVEDLDPFEHEDYQLDIDVGSAVSIDDYQCAFQVTARDASGSFTQAISLSPRNPTLTVSVVGAPDIKIWDLEGSDRVEMNVTGNQVSATVPPTVRSFDVYLYLENLGDVALEPQLRTKSGNMPKLLDEYNLDGKWRGVTTEGSAPVSLTTAADRFTLPVSDPDEVGEVLIRELFPTDTGTPNDPAGIPDDLWTCAGEDSGSSVDADTDPRAVCRVHFRFNVGDRAVAGDHVAYNLTFEDPDQADVPASNVTVRLRFAHIGEIGATEVTRKVVGLRSSAQAQSSRITAQAQLDDGHAFPDENTIDASMNATFRESGSEINGQPNPNACTAYLDPDTQDNDPDSETITSSFLDEDTARFQPIFRFQQGSQCSITRDTGTDGTWIVEAPADTAGTLSVSFDVRDDEGIRVHQPAPIQIRTTGEDTLVSAADDPGSFSFEPSDEIDANGTQFVRMAFNPGDDGSGFPSGAEEGLLLSRSAQANDLLPFTRCALDGASVSTQGTTLKWRRLGPVAGTDGFDYNNSDDQEIAGDVDIRGAILEDEDDNDAPLDTDRTGNIAIYGWGSQTKLTWHEGWNPIVLYVTDTQGSPADRDTNLDLDFQFTVRDPSDNNNVSDTYEFSEQDNTLNVRSMGRGFFKVDLYLPSDIATGTLADWPDPQNVQTQEVESSAFALHARIQNGQSIENRQINGDAYWRLADLGMISASSADVETGTSGTSTIQPGIVDNRIELPDDNNQEDYLHPAIRFLEPLMTARTESGSAWTTGPGVHNYTLFLMSEDEQSTSNPFDNQAEKDIVEHRFNPVTDATVNFTVFGTQRIDLPGIKEYALAEGNQDGLYGGIFVLPDTGKESFRYNTVLSVTGNDGSTHLRTSQAFVTDEDMEPAVNGLPMPLCVTRPTGAVSDEAGDFDFANQDLQISRVLDLRALPGLAVDRGRFSMTPLVQNADEGISFTLDPAATFEVFGDSLVTLDPDQLPTAAEEDVSFELRIRPSGVVSSMRATLSDQGTTADETTLTDDDRDGIWTGTLTPTESVNYTLRLVATDTAGGTTSISSTVDVDANQAPRITIDSPSKPAENATRAMRPDGTIEVTVQDRALGALANPATDRSWLTVETKLGGDGGEQGQALEADNVTIDGLLDRDTVGEHSLTLTFPNETDGTAWVNFTGTNFDAADAFDTINGTSFTGGETTGAVTFNATGTYELTVQTNGTADETFTVEVVETGDDGFSTVSLTAGDLDCEETRCTVSIQPSGLSDGDTLQLRVTAEFNADDTSTLGPVDIDIDGVAPSVSIKLQTPKVTSTTPTRIGTDTGIRITGDSEVVQGRVFGIRNGAETGSSTFNSLPTTVTPGDLQIRQGGKATIQVNASDAAGNQVQETLEVRVDNDGPDLSGASGQISGPDAVLSVTASDPAGIKNVKVFAKKPADAQFISRTMTKATGDTYEATITSPGTEGELEYYFQATDRVSNSNSLRDTSNPYTLSLGTITNAEPTLAIDEPTDGATVSGTFELVLNVSDPEGQTVTISSIEAAGSGGAGAIPITVDDDTARQVPVNTSQLDEGLNTITVEVTDGTNPVSASVQVNVNNLLDPCEQSPERLEDGSVRFCVQQPAGATGDVTMELYHNGQRIAQATAQCSGGTCTATFPSGDVPTNTPVRPDVVVTGDDGSSQRFEGEVQSIADAVLPDEPLGRFITTLVLGVVTVGLAAFAAFGRWD